MARKDAIRIHKLGLSAKNKPSDLVFAVKNWRRELRRRREPRHPCIGVGRAAVATHVKKAPDLDIHPICLAHEKECFERVGRQDRNHGGACPCDFADVIENFVDKTGQGRVNSAIIQRGLRPIKNRESGLDTRFGGDTLRVASGQLRDLKLCFELRNPSVRALEFGDIRIDAGFRHIARRKELPRPFERRFSKMLIRTCLIKIGADDVDLGAAASCLEVFEICLCNRDLGHGRLQRGCLCGVLETKERRPLPNDLAFFNGKLSDPAGRGGRDIDIVALDIAVIDGGPCFAKVRKDD